MKQAAPMIFNRYEIKYLLPVDKAKEVKEDLKKYLIPDEFGDQYGNYVLSSLYYDTRDFRFYHEKINGLKHRRKLRIRLYETQEPTTASSLVFVEIKERVDKIIRKRRVKLTLAEALALGNEFQLPSLEGKDDCAKAVIEEMYEMLHIGNLQPTIITTYLRQAFHGTRFDRGLRITFDTNVRYRRERLDLSEKDPGHFMIPPDTCIMEIKTNNTMPIWLTQLIARHNLQIFRISKYCSSLEKAEERIKHTNYLFA